MYTFLQDLKYAARVLRRNPAFTVTAVMALTLGIGAATGIFSIVNAVLLKPLDILEPDRVVVLSMTSGSGTGDGDAVSPAKFQHFRAQSSVIQDVTAAYTGLINYKGGELVEQWRSLKVSADGFRCFGIPILLGRTFSRDEDLPNGPMVVVISEDLWNRRFAGDPNVQGRTIRLNGEPHTIIGVAGPAPSIFDSGLPPEVYVPFKLDPDSDDQGDSFAVLARLRPGVMLEQARARLAASSGGVSSQVPNRHWSPR
jgi:hypothetical protein